MGVDALHEAMFWGFDDDDDAMAWMEIALRWATNMRSMPSFSFA